MSGNVIPDEVSWLHFVARSGREGLQWVEEYHRGRYEELVAKTDQSLALLRLHRLAEGREILRQVETVLEELAPASASIPFVLGRWFHAALAYWQYLCEDFEGAERSLYAAHHTVCTAIALNPFLLPLASHCSDFGLQRIRIARNQRCWKEMEARIGHVRNVLANRLPLCTLTTGTSIYLATVADFYLALSPLDEKETKALRTLQDQALQLERFERFVDGLYILPGFVIGYP